MRCITRFWFAFVLSFALMAGCSDENGEGGSGGEGGTGGVETVSVPFVITGFDPEGGLTGPLEDVQICETDTNNCVMTDADGAAMLQVPLNQETSVTMEKEGFQSELLAAVLGEEPPVFTNGLGTVERTEFLHGLVGSPYPMEGTGDILASWASLGPFPGATLDSDDAAAIGFYYDENGNWDSSLTATTAYVLGPKAGFTEVSPGVVRVEFGGTAEDCVPATGWPGDVGNSVRVPVRAGYLSEFVLSCDVP